MADGRKRDTTKSRRIKAIAKAKRTTPTAPVTASSSSLLAAILASPDDDGPRRIYADHLAEQGDPRGELIALQLSSAIVPDDDPRRAEVAAREAELIKQHKKAWTAFGDAPGARWEYRRGFIAKASLDAAALAKIGKALLAAEPVEELAVWKIDEHRGGLASVLRLPLGRVKRLAVARSRLKLADWKALAGADTLGSVEVLDATATAIGEVKGAAAVLAAARSLPKLRELRLSSAYVDDTELVAIARSVSLPIERLIATNNAIGPRGLAALVAAPWARRLVELDLSSNETIGAEGLAVLAEATTLPALKTLRLDYAGIWSDAEAAVAAVLGSPVFARLDRLDLTNNIGAEGLDRIREVFGDRLV
jgi:uncharacterized protein (TIGR02996 family)